MARVHIEQAAFTDSRFVTLARLAGLADRFAAIGRMALVWNECTERESTELARGAVADLHPDIPHFFDAMIGANLARFVSPDIAYICGTTQRCLWLKRKRETARVNGAKSNGRPPKSADDLPLKPHVKEIGWNRLGNMSGLDDYPAVSSTPDPSDLSPSTSPTIHES